MQIKYTDGTKRIVADSVDTITTCLNADLPAGWVHYNGLVWNSEDESENDDGARAVAEIQDDNGNRVMDVLP